MDGMGLRGVASCCMATFHSISLAVKKTALNKLCKKVETVKLSMNQAVKSQGCVSCEVRTSSTYKK
jgi:hypothetical protein